MYVSHTGTFFSFQNEMVWYLSSTDRESNRDSGWRPFRGVHEVGFLVGLSHNRPLLTIRMVFNHSTIFYYFYSSSYYCLTHKFYICCFKDKGKKRILKYKLMRSFNSKNSPQDTICQVLKSYLSDQNSCSTYQDVSNTWKII